MSDTTPMIAREPPPVAADTDVRDLDGFMLNVERLLASELVAIGTPEECWAALMLWCRAWKQVPAGSLPNDDRVLASFSGAGPRWRKVREVALHGFVECSDGRLYHRFLCQEVMRASERREAFRRRRDAERKRIAEWREKRVRHADVTRTDPITDPITDHITERDGTHGVTRCVALETGTGTGTGTGNLSLPDFSDEKSSRERGARGAPGSLSQDFTIHEVWINEARSLRRDAGLDPVNLAAEAAKFLASKTGPPARGAWIRWAMNARPERPTGLGKINGNLDAIPEPQRSAPAGPPPKPEELWRDERG